MTKRRTPLCAAALTAALLVSSIASAEAADGWSSTTKVEGNTMASDVLAAPSALAATRVSPTDIALTWAATPSTYADGYLVYRATSETGPWKQIATVNGTAKTSWTHANAPQGTTWYMVRAYRINWSSGESNVSSGAIAVSVRDDFNGTGALGLAEFGKGNDDAPYAYVQSGGTWSRSGAGRAVTSALVGASPRAAVATTATDVDITISTEAASGEAIYLRLDQATNTWIRARVSRYDIDEPYTIWKTEYEWMRVDGTETNWEQIDTETYISSYTYSAGAWKGVSETGCLAPDHPHYAVGNHYHNPHSPSGLMQLWTKTYGEFRSSQECASATRNFYEMQRRDIIATPVYSTRNVATGIYYWATVAKDGNDRNTGKTRPKTMGTYWGAATTADPDDYKTGATRQVANGTGYNTVSRWRTVLEKQVAGVITALDSYDHDTTRPTSLRVTAVGSTISTYLNGSTLVGTVNDATNHAATSHGVGLAGPTVTPTNGISSWSLAEIE